MGKKAINWSEIEARYKLGERPVDIAKDFKLCTSEKIRQKAKRDKWKEEKDTITKETLDCVVERRKDALTELCDLTKQVHVEFLRKLVEKDEDETSMLDKIHHPFLLDGEKVNSLFQTTMNNSTKIMIALLKQAEAQAGKNTDAGEPFVLKIDRQSDART